MPKLVHAAWFQGEAALPPAYQRTAAALRATNPGWTVLLHDAASLRAACRAADDLAGGGLGLGALAGYDAAELLIQKVDLGRYAAAYAYAAAYVGGDAARDRSLAGFCENVVQILIELDAPGCRFLPLTEAPVAA